MNNEKVLPIALAGIVIAGLSFIAGMEVQKSRTNSSVGHTIHSSPMMRGDDFGPRGKGRMMVRPTTGEVTSKSDSELTIKSQNGKSTKVKLDNNTSYKNGVGGVASASDVKTGDSVAVLCTRNSDGSLSAKEVIINPSINNRSSDGPEPRTNMPML